MVEVSPDVDPQAEPARKECVRASGDRPEGRPRNARALAALTDWHDKTRNVARVLVKAGIPTSTYYEWLSGLRPVPAEGLGDIVRASGDLTLAVEALGLSGVAMILPAKQGSLAVDIRDCVLGIVSADGDLARMTTQALADGRIDSTEGKQLARQLDEVERRAETARTALRGGGRR